MDAREPDSTDLLARAVTALGGSRRAGQEEMARAVEHALGQGEHLLVQAGTGTGKSLAYLVPAAAHAVRAGERVIVSTATLALQRQIVARDLPLVVEALADALPRPPKVALLKGWHNYVCRHKLTGGYPVDEPAGLFEAPRGEDHPAGAGDRSTLGEAVLRARAWAEETATGDRDELVPGVPDRAWRQVSVTALECLGPGCPLRAECFPEQAREEARAADVVVTNHAMLGIAASGSPGVLPEHQALVVDEAHELTDRVTAAATAELSAATVAAASRLARRQGVATGDLDDAGVALGAVLVPLPEGRLPGGPPAEVQATVAVVGAAARALLTALRPDAEKPDDGGRKVAAAAVLTVFEIAERLTGDGVATGRDVVWCERGEGGRGGGPRLMVAPVSVAGMVRTGVLAGRSAVLTSATLQLGGGFGHAAGSVGLSGEEEVVGPVPAASGGATTAPERDPDPTHAQVWRGMDVGSPFDHARAGILYVARHLPAPGREPATEAQLDEIAGLIEAAGGATLGLFSSRRAAEAAAEAMRARLDVPVLCQGEDQLPALVAQFAADDATCLFGTLSLWQGVDVPGPTCRLVLIDRIPFPRPDDPVRSARQEAVAAAGGNGFMQVAAAHAALLLAQGSGRLLRRTEDRGVVAVLDPRLVTARYGNFLTRSMPPLWPTTDPEVVRAALTRLRDSVRTEA